MHKKFKGAFQENKVGNMKIIESTSSEAALEMFDTLSMPKRDRHVPSGHDPYKNTGKVWGGFSFDNIGGK